ncbi:MAG: hypothetical protein F4114_07800 [Rhodospirillaceae bacterium]|nr:hypothetical protein [Rhodospirillaceae bacterium]
MQRDQRLDAALELADHRGPVGREAEGPQRLGTVQFVGNTPDKAAAAPEICLVVVRPVGRVEPAVAGGEMPMNGAGGSQARWQRIEDGAPFVVQLRQPVKHRDIPVGLKAASRTGHVPEQRQEPARQGAMLDCDVDAAQQVPGRVESRLASFPVRLFRGAPASPPFDPFGLMLDVAEAGVLVRFRPLPRLFTPRNVRRLPVDQRMAAAGAIFCSVAVRARPFDAGGCGGWLFRLGRCRRRTAGKLVDADFAGRLCGHVAGDCRHAARCIGLRALPGLRPRPLHAVEGFGVGLALLGLDLRAGHAGAEGAGGDALRAAERAGIAGPAAGGQCRRCLGGVFLRLVFQALLLNPDLRVHRLFGRAARAHQPVDLEAPGLLIGAQAVLDRGEAAVGFPDPPDARRVAEPGEVAPGLEQVATVVDPARPDRPPDARRRNGRARRAKWGRM